MAKIIFFGNGPLADYALPAFQKSHEIIFHAKTREDLAEVIKLKQSHPDAYGVLASFGVIIKSDILELFEPLGILNIHPSKLPAYRGPSPIETAILAGDEQFSVSIMKLVAAMDAGPIYYQTTIPLTDLPTDSTTTLPFTKSALYQALATTGADWLSQNLEHLPEPILQEDEDATYTAKLDKSMSPLQPATKSAAELLREIIAFAGFPKSTYKFNNIDCIIHSAHISDSSETQLSLACADGKYLTIDTIQPAGRKIMDGKSFINGYLK